MLYDANCPICRKARHWVERQRQLVPLEFVAVGSPLARLRFPELDVRSTLADVTVITDRGAVLRGDDAWIAVLWSLARTRPLAVKLAHGQSRWMFRNVKGATEAIRRFSADQPDRRPDATGPAEWAPPRGNPVAGGACDSFRT